MKAFLYLANTNEPNLCPLPSIGTVVRYFSLLTCSSGNNLTSSSPVKFSSVSDILSKLSLYSIENLFCFVSSSIITELSCISVKYKPKTFPFVFKT